MNPQGIASPTTTANFAEALKDCMINMLKCAIFSQHRWLAVSLMLAFLIFPIGLKAQLTVDCSGTNPSAFPSINAALAHATEGTSITVLPPAPCNEDVTLYGQNNLTIGAPWGQTAQINGTFSIQNSQLIFLYGLSITSASGDGIDVSGSRSVTLDTCSSSGNVGDGLSVFGRSDVAVLASGAFNNNGSHGIITGEGSFVNILSWAGIVKISNNKSNGIRAGQADFQTLGQTTIANNGSGGSSLPLPLGTGFGVDLRGGAKAQFGAVFGSNVLQGNQTGGASLQENSEISFWVCCGSSPNIIAGNGQIGIAAGFGSQVTLFEGAQVTDHTAVGIDVYGNSQLFTVGPNEILRNGTSSDLRSAGIRVDGNSEILLRGGEVSQNNGPAILVLVNSSADFTGVAFSANGGGIITCDSTSAMISDIAGPHSTPPAGVRCGTPHNLGNRQISTTPQAIPDISSYKAAHDRYRRLVTGH